MRSWWQWIRKKQYDFVTEDVFLLDPPDIDETTPEIQ
jgi:hypothetical protein